MQRFLIAFMLSLVLAGTAGAAEKNGWHLLTVITDDSAQTQAMALILTRQWLKDGGSARILLCDAAGGMAVTSSDEGGEAVQPPDVAPRQMLGGLMEAGVQVDACAIYLPTEGMDQSDLRKGVGVATPPAIGKVMADPDTRLFSF
jgi:intracellular sulfur oxidation DsrE/DsrF family protein